MRRSRARRARIQPYLDLGFTHFVFHAPGSDQERFLRLYAKEVLPRLRELEATATAVGIAHLAPRRWW